MQLRRHENGHRSLHLRRPVGVSHLRRQRKLGGLSLILTSASLVLAGCVADGPSVLNPGGPRASRIADLWWFLFAIGTVVFLVVIALLFVGVFRAWRRQVEGREQSTGSGIAFIGVGVTITALITTAVFGFTLWTLAALAGPNEPSATTITVIGNRWWWDVRYPEAGVITANEIHIPVGEPVRVQLTADDVIHSFWVPELAGKLDLIPGRVNTFWLEADKPGTYRGQCAEFCGVQHAHMAFLVIAEPREDFDAWLQAQSQPAAEAAGPIVERGRDVFLTAGCAACHTVRGTEANGQVGPDLTHLASRQTLAAGTLDFSYGALSGWVADPQGIKPGAQMPNVRLTAEELSEVVSYLLSLQ